MREFLKINLPICHLFATVPILIDCIGLWAYLVKTAEHCYKKEIYNKQHNEYGLIRIKEEGLPGFPKGWQGCSDGFSLSFTCLSPPQKKFYFSR